MSISGDGHNDVGNDADVDPSIEMLTQTKGTHAW